MNTKLRKLVKPLNFPCDWRWLIGILFCASLVISALADTLREKSVDELAKGFRAEEVRMELELKELQLRFYQGEITGEEVQKETENWRLRNLQSLELQARRAASLQRMAPDYFEDEADPYDRLLNSVRVIELPSERELTVAEMEYAEIQKVISEAHQRIHREHNNGYDAWIAFGDWSEANHHLVERSEELSAEMANEQWNRMEPIEIELPEDASPEEQAFADLEEQRVARTFELREQHSELGPSEFRDVIHNDSELTGLRSEQETYYKRLTAAELVREISQLKEEKN